ncbi:NAD(P)-dependent oxidoreductase [Lentibacter algarum]|uniref:NAD-dependent epimerase/dehydratase family protein n=1 Tax=Lentibacter algarum TaxID=576131 RepID=UPI001C065298|nr:NAD(P)-dependent oxidoreductase [Lentibacter algarum]MBU2980203.1 NAD(P)-dependent oxidoreductase [Lentibacter algarum]
MTKKRLVITGGSGRLGRFVVDRLKEKYTVTVIDRIAPAAADVAYLDVDICDLKAMTEALTGADYVIHLAAVPNPRTASEEACFEVNTKGTWTLLQAAETVGVKRAVIAGSDAATGLHYNPVGWPPQYLPVDENHPMRPSEVYSLTKEITHAIGKSFSVRGKLEVLSICPAHIVFEPEYPELGARGADVHNYHLWSYVAPQDVAQGFELALEVADGSFDSFYIAAADGLNVRPTLEMLKERFGEVPEVRDASVYENHPTASVFDINRAREKLGYAPKYTWRDFPQPV